ncbi:MAG TPA: glutathionylspermidine synthase family protein [Caulobacteraceae bacterium]|nr:glutathionylspermidine synthase family protein [Caulobacteraceae bacterium]
MIRRDVAPRNQWRRSVEEQGLIWHSAGGAPYWNESAYYGFALAEIEEIEAATAELYAMFLAAGQYVVDKQLFGRFAIPEWCWPLITSSWTAEPPALNYGRFDLGYDGRGPPKLFEFNCDTPTSLLEAAVIQWTWKEEVFPYADQFTSLHDKLIAKWKDIAPYLAPGVVHFAHAADTTGEDAITTAYLMDTAREAGLVVDGIVMADIGRTSDGRFVDLQNREMRTVYKLYPWEWMVHEPFGRALAQNDRTLWIEPIWKMIWSNKAILPILWDMYPRHPNLLWASFDQVAGDNYVRKPILGREGANVDVVVGGRPVAQRDGAYGAFPTIRQGLHDLPDFDGARPVVGSWVVDGVPAGMGIREDGLITGNLSRFVPHIIT